METTEQVLEEVQSVETKTEAKNTEVFEKVLMNAEDMLAIDSKVSEIKEWIVEHKGAGELEPKEKDTLWLEINKKWNELGKMIREVRMSIPLNYDQYEFLFALVHNKMEYTADSIFVGLKIKELFFKEKWKFSKDKTKAVFYFNSLADEKGEVVRTEDGEAVTTGMKTLTVLYHFLSYYKVTGLNKNAYLFADILSYIGELSKQFNNLDTLSKDLKKDIDNWTADITDNELEKPKVETNTETEQ